VKLDFDAVIASRARWLVRDYFFYGWVRERYGFLRGARVHRRTVAEARFKPYPYAPVKNTRTIEHIRDTNWSTTRGSVRANCRRI
jgi:hypothetical protein